MIALSRIQAGNYHLEDLAVPKDFVHLDNTELVPDGCACKLNYEAIKSRPQNDKLEDFIQWVEEHKDVELHVSRENAVNSLICFEEDVRYTTDEQTGTKVRVDPWLFDVYTDILIKNKDGEYKTVVEVEEELEKEKRITEENTQEDAQNVT